MNRGVEVEEIRCVQRGKMLGGLDLYSKSPKSEVYWVGNIYVVKWSSNIFNLIYRFL